MKKVKEYFSNPKKVILFIIGILVLCGIIFFAANAVLNHILIGKKEAKSIALSDAGVSSDNVSKIRVELDFDHGSFEYEVEFYSKGNEYEYTIDGKSGEIISKDTDYQKLVKVPSENQQTPTSAEQDTISQKTSAEQDTISQETAKEIALKNAGLAETEITFTKTKLDREDGILIYKIEFYSAEAEYEYEINAINSEIVSMETKNHHIDSESFGNSDKYIGVDQAKSIALEHAEISGDEVVFSKAKLENDDGRTVYEIEFRYGKTEYEYMIDAVSGNIIEYDFEQF